MIEQLENKLTLLDGFPDANSYTSWEEYSLSVQNFFIKMGNFSQEQIDLLTALKARITQFNNTSTNINDAEENVGQIEEIVNNLKEETIVVKNLAQKYATEDEDVEVSTGEFSAKHWAKKAASAVANIPAGTIIDILIGLDKTWSSTKIKGELDLKADKTEVELKRLEKIATDDEPEIVLNPTTSLFYSVTVNANLNFIFADFNEERMQQVILELKNGGAFAVTFTGVKWLKLDGTFATTIADVGLSLQSAGTDYLMFFSPNGIDIIGKVLR